MTAKVRVVKAQRSDLAMEVEDYLRACRARGVRPATIRDSYGYSLRGVLLPWCQGEGIRSAAEIDTRTLERFAAELRDRVTREGKPLSPATVWTYLKAANLFLKWYSSEHDATAPKIRLHQPAGRKVQTLDRDEIEALERAAPTERDRVLIRLLADTGIRPGELVSITGADLRKVGNRHYVRVRGKSGERDAPVMTALYTRLQSLAHGDDEPIFRSLRKGHYSDVYEPLTVSGVRQAIRDIGHNAGLRSDLNAYIFRHSCCRWLLMSGESTIVVERILGHGSAEMIRRHYANIGVDDAHDRLMTLLRAER